jgi:AcrR family transcriptional regulator
LILRVAREEFAAHGFAATRVETLARKARVNKALLYYYFGSKLGLYKHIIHDGVDRFAARMREVAEAQATAEEKVARWVEALATHLTDEPTLPLMMLRELADGGSHLDAETLRELTIFVPLLRSLIEQGQREGVFGRGGPDHAALHAHGLDRCSSPPTRPSAAGIRQLGYASRRLRSRRSSTTSSTWRSARYARTPIMPIRSTDRSLPRHAARLLSSPWSSPRLRRAGRAARPTASASPATSRPTMCRWRRKSAAGS